uniref:Uncharacterized protein n=1 Tax=Rhizophora mucronata TaxID=61149 RepID=A0A2P2QTF0_RHIMU
MILHIKTCIFISDCIGFLIFLFHHPKPLFSQCGVVAVEVTAIQLLKVVRYS